MESLNHLAKGHFVVATESGSRYLIDFDRQEFVRLPSAAEENLLRMRGDFSQVHLVRLVECVVGAAMQLIIDLGVPGVAFTTRQTTTVVAIAKVPTDIEKWELDILISALGQRDEPLEEALTEEEELNGNR